MNCHLLSSLRKLRDWSFAFVMALLPQHLIAQLGNADLFPAATYAAHTGAPHAATVPNTGSPSVEAPPSVASPDAGATDTQANPTR